MKNYNSVYFKMIQERIKGEKIEKRGSDFGEE
jgi:hypothetical protein